MNQRLAVYIKAQSHSALNNHKSKDLRGQPVVVFTPRYQELAPHAKMSHRR